MGIIEPYLRHIQEGYFLSDKTISIDLHKFESGESKKLIIAGLSGAGKTTLGNYLAKKYNCYFNDGDKCCRKALDSSNIGLFSERKPSEQSHLFKLFFDKCFKPMLLSNRIEVIDGVLYQIYNLFPKTQSFINKYPVIIIGKSALKSVWGRSQRAFRKPKDRPRRVD